VHRYIVSRKQKQSTFTGKQQRRAFNALPFVVPGLFARVNGNPPPDEVSPGGSLGDLHRVRTQNATAAVRSTPRARAIWPAVSTQAQGNSNIMGQQKVNEDGYDADTDEDLAVINPGFKYDWVAYRAAFGDTTFPQAVSAMFAEYALLYARIAGEVG